MNERMISRLEIEEKCLYCSHQVYKCDEELFVLSLRPNALMQNDTKIISIEDLIKNFFKHTIFEGPCENSKCSGKKSKFTRVITHSSNLLTIHLEKSQLPYGYEFKIPLEDLSVEEESKLRGKFKYSLESLLNILDFSA